MTRRRHAASFIGAAPPESRCQGSVCASLPPLTRQARPLPPHRRRPQYGGATSSARYCCRILRPGPSPCQQLANRGDAPASPPGARSAAPPQSTLTSSPPALECFRTTAYQAESTHTEALPLTFQPVPPSPSDGCPHGTICRLRIDAMPGRSTRFVDQRRRARAAIRPCSPKAQDPESRPHRLAPTALEN